MKPNIKSQTIMFIYFVIIVSSFVTGCTDEGQLITETEQSGSVYNKSVESHDAISQTSNRAPFFDAELNRRGNLSAYTKTSSSTSAMIVNPSRIRVVTDPVYGAKRKVMLMDVRPQDSGGVTENPRAQVQTPMNYVEGQEVFVGFSVRFTKTFWTYFLTFSEIYGAPYKGTAPFRLAIQESYIIASTYNGNKQVNLWKQPMQANYWYDFVYRQVLSKDAEKGEVQVWLRKSGEKVYTKILSAKVATITAANIQGPNYHKLACYYDKTNTFTNASRKTRVSEIKMYFANHKVGSSFDEVKSTLMQ